MHADHSAKQIFLWSYRLSCSHIKTWEYYVKRELQRVKLSEYTCTESVATEHLLLLYNEKVKEEYEIDWNEKLWNDDNKPNGNKLRYYRNFKMDTSPEPYACCNLSVQHRSVLARLRNDTLPINIELGRHQRPVIPLHERVCNLCHSQSIEDGPHILLECRLYDDLRRNLIRILEGENLLMASSLEQFNFLLSSPVVKTQQALAKTIFNIMKRRKSFNI